MGWLAGIDILPARQVEQGNTKCEGGNQASGLKQDLRGTSEGRLQRNPMFAKQI